MKNELMNMEMIDPVQIFERDGLEALLVQIRARALSIVADVKTSNGRAIMASTGHWVARSKTVLDGFGKALNAKRDRKTNLVNKGRKHARDFLDNVKQEVLRPKVEWEATEAAEKAGKERQEQERISDIKHELDNISIVAVDIATKTATELAKIMDFLYAYPLTEKVFEEFLGQAMERFDLAVSRVEKQIEIREQLDTEAADRKMEDTRLAEQKAEQDKEQSRLDKRAFDLSERERVAPPLETAEYAVSAVADQKAEKGWLVDVKKEIEKAKRKVGDCKEAGGGLKAKGELEPDDTIKAHQTRIADALIEEGLDIPHLEALYKIIRIFNYGEVAKAEIFEFADHLVKKYDQ